MPAIKAVIKRVVKNVFNKIEDMKVPTNNPQAIDSIAEKPYAGPRRYPRSAPR